nr:hypothetical protein [Tanacetum cinerariifolium]
MTFDETPQPSKTSSLVDDDLDEEEAIKVTKKRKLENDIADETLEINEVAILRNLGNIADDKAIQTILLGVPKDIYAAVDSYETTQEIWLRFYNFAVNWESARDVYSKRRIIAITKHKIVEWHNYKHLDWITVRRDDDKLYKFKEGDFKRIRIQDIEDIYQKKLNLTRPDMYRFDLKRKEDYIAYSNPRGFIYQNKDKQNRLMRIDEFHKFSDGTLTDIRTALDDRLKGIRMKYLPQTIWRKSDKDRTPPEVDKQSCTSLLLDLLAQKGYPDERDDIINIVSLRKYSSRDTYFNPLKSKP